MLELALSTTALIPYAQRAAAGSPEVAAIVADARRAVDFHRRQLGGVITRTVLEASLAHLTSHEREALADGVAPQPLVLLLSGPAGALLALAGEHSSDVLGPGLAALSVFMAARGFVYVLLDPSGPVLPGVPVLSHDPTEPAAAPPAP